MVGFILVLGIGLILVWAIWYSFSKLIKKGLTGWAKFLGWIGLIIFVIGCVMSYNSEDDSTSNQANSTNSSSKTKSSSKEQTSKSSSKSDHKVKNLDTINNKMEDSLEEDKKFAQNGNESYNYALEINQWQLRQSGYIYILIDGTKFFNEKDLGVRQKFIDKIANSANGAYSIASNDYDDSHKNIKVFVDGMDDPVAESGVSNHQPKLTGEGKR